MTTTENITNEIANKITTNPTMQAAALEGPEAFEAALEVNLRNIIEQHGKDMANAFTWLDHLTTTDPAKVRSYFAPRILAAL